MVAQSSLVLNTSLTDMNIKHKLTVIAILLVAGICNHATAQSLTVDEMVVVLIDAVDVPANETGVIAEINVHEGHAVTAGQQLGMLDDRKARLQESLARTQLEIATEMAGNALATDVAKKKLAEQQQLAKQHEITREIAGRKAENDVRVLASSKTEAVAKNELDRATRARQEYVDSVSRSEIDGLRLTYEKTRLETQQADFELKIDVLHAATEKEAATGHALSIERSKIEVEQAIADQRVQQLQAQLQQHQTQLAALTTLQHKIVSPIGGVVVQRFRHKGDWVTAGDPVVRVIRLNRLRAEGFVPSETIDHLRQNRSVQLTIEMGADKTVQREGEIVFISPEIDPVNNEVRFWVEFDNPELDVLPGMRLSLRSKS